MTLRQDEFHLPIRTEKTLRDFVKFAWGISIPDTQICPNHSTPWRAFVDAYFARSPVSVWHGSRGFAGKSFTLALLSMTEAVTLGADVNVLGGSGEQSKRVLEHMQNLWHSDSAPRQMLQADAATVTRLSNGARVAALMASQASVRGPHPQRLRLDEIDEMDIRILDAAMGQTMSKDGIKPQTVMSSTRQYSDGTMQEILRRASEKSWKVFEWCYKETAAPHGWLAPVDIEQKRGEVTTAMWQTEYENQEPNPSARAIQPAAVERMFDKSLGEFDGSAHEYIEIEAPAPNGEYATGADWARKGDWTIITTYRTDVKPVRCVAWERTGRLDWPVMVRLYDERLKRFAGAGVHDGTGIGDVVDGYITAGGSRAFIMAGRPRADLLSEYVNACEKGDIVYPFIRYAYQEHKFASVEAVMSGGTEHLPDSISAGALGWNAVSKKPWLFMN